MNALETLQVLDWRRQVFALYVDVRAAGDPSTGHALWRSGRDRLFAEHPASPLSPEAKADFAGLPVAPYDPAWRFEITIGPTEPTEIEMSTGTDGDVAFERVGVVQMPEVGTLDLWRLTGYGGGLFLPFRDASAGRPGGTYGGGRYLLDTAKGADLGTGTLGTDAETTLVIDLNFAYNPSCAYDEAWACPLAPPGNVLDVAVPVGELI